jgi:hypothetical protein
MDEFSYDVAPKVKGALTTAHKAVMAFLSFLGTYAGVLIADVSEAADWVNQVLVVAGGAVGTALVYWTKNRPKR